MKNQMYQIYPVDCISGVRKHLEANTVDLIITDPPYGIKANNLHRHYHRKEEHVIEGYVEIPAEQYASFSRKWIFEAERVLRPGGSIYIISGYSNLKHILNALAETGLEEINHIIWKYNFGVHTRKKYISSHYHILYYAKPGGDITFNTYSRFGPGERDDRKGSLNYQDREDVWFVPRQYKPGKAKNKNELPDDLLIKMIQYSSNQGDLVADFFLGGFGTAKIALGLNRRITGFEVNQNSFRHNIPMIESLKPGYLLPDLRQASENFPPNERKRWTPEEKTKLKTQYMVIYNRLKHKGKTIKVLEKEFGRGYFAILNKLEQLLKN